MSVVASALVKYLGIGMGVGVALVGIVDSSNAAIINQTFTANVFSGQFAGQSATGSFTYDDSLLNGMGDESLTPEDGLTLTMTFLGQTYTESNDIDNPLFPVIEFSDGVPIFMDYLISESNFFNPTEILEPGIKSLEVFAELIPGQEGNLETVLNVNVTVPEPTIVLGLMLLGTLGMGSGLQRKLKR